MHAPNVTCAATQVCVLCCTWCSRIAPGARASGPGFNSRCAPTFSSHAHHSHMCVVCWSVHQPPSCMRVDCLKCVRVVSVRSHTIHVRGVCVRMCGVDLCAHVCVHACKCVVCTLTRLTRVCGVCTFVVSVFWAPESVCVQREQRVCTRCECMCECVCGHTHKWCVLRACVC